MVATRQISSVLASLNIQAMTEENLAAAGAALEADMNRKADLVIAVGPGGQYATMNAGLEEARRIRVGYKNKGVRIEVRQLAGFVFAEQVFVVQEDLSYVTVTSEDAEVEVLRQALVSGDGNSANNWRVGVFPQWCARRGGLLPYIDTLYAMNLVNGPSSVPSKPTEGYGTTGIYLFEGAKGVIARGKGVKNAGWRGLYYDYGFPYARQTVWTGAGFAGGVEGAAGGIRGSNHGVGMVRQVDCSGSKQGAYFSDTNANVSDANFGNCTELGISVNAGANVYGGGIQANGCGTYGFAVTNGGKLVSGESSNTSGVYPSATDCGLAGLFMDNGGEAVLERPTLSTIAGAPPVGEINHAVQMTNSFARLSAATIIARGTGARGANSAEGSELIAQSAQITSLDDWAVRLYNGSNFNGSNTRLEGASGAGEVQVNTGSEVSLAGALRADGTSTPRLNVFMGEVSPLGRVRGLDDGRHYRTYSSSPVSLSSGSRPVQIWTGALTAPVVVNLSADSSGYPWKAFQIIHGGTGQSIEIYRQAGGALLETVAPGANASVVTDGSGGWIVTQ